jgi:cytochrome c oxidase subunit III
VTAPSVAQTLDEERLPAGPAASSELGWWGMALVCATEGALFAFLIASYFYLGARQPSWPPATDGAPQLVVPFIMTSLLLVSSTCLFWGERQMAKGRLLPLAVAIGATIVVGIVFVALQLIEFQERLRHAAPQSDSYESIFFATTGFHGIHVVVGLLLLLYAGLRSLRGHFSQQGYVGVKVTSLYWHFVGVVWFAIVLALYVSPHLGRGMR